MNAGIFIMTIIMVAAVGFWLYTESPKGKKWIKGLN